VAAAVLPRQGTAPGIGELQDHCRTLIAGYKVPREVVLVAELPMTAAGKPDAKAAREFFGS
jgi:acyl-CoA synthetase (AMP-forming)/AMP-acid ligase II